jgi:hypothetical protein
MSSKRSPLPDSTLGRALGSLATLAAVLGLLAQAADADVAVYASRDSLGANEGQVEIQTASVDTIPIWIEGGSGNEICGYDVLLEIQGEGCFTNSFDPDSGTVVYQPTGPLSCATTQLHAAFVGVNPCNDPVHIGDLDLNATGTTGSTSLVVLGKHAVPVGLTLENIPQDTIATTPVPEPGEILLLASGIAGLAGLYRLRRGSLGAG